VSLGYFRGADGAERWGVELHGERAKAEAR